MTRTMTRRLARHPVLRRAILAVVLIAYLVPALGGLMGGICLTDRGVALGCCVDEAAGAACACCGGDMPSSRAPDPCCGLDATATAGRDGDLRIDPTRDESRRDDGCCLHISPADEPAAPSGAGGPTLPEPPPVAAVGAEFAPICAARAATDLALPRPEPPPPRAGLRPFVLRV
ncbi:MAG: hypothetical protein HMLKMBBP_01144 [Planctomycetes bacterium]|nr:hypothetical protein [Planctomycetota bacterium]